MILLASLIIIMKYNYKARNIEGGVQEGVIEASSKEAAALLLQKYNIFVTSLSEERAGESFLKKIELTKRVSKKDLAVFFRQLSIMLESRVPVVQTLQSLAAQTNRASFKKTVAGIAGLVEEGFPISDACAFYPKVFDNFYINLIKSGEASGKISDALYYVSDHFEKESDIIAQIKQAMVYPAFVISVLFVVMAIIVIQLMPKIAELIKETGVEPSFFTKMMLNFYKFLGDFWWILAIILPIFIVFLIYYFQSKSGKKKYDKISLKLPLIKEFLKKVFIVRFCSNISTLLIAGVPINRALRITGETVDNTIYKEIVLEIEQKVSEGEKMSQVLLRHQDYFPLFVTQIVKVGEETGKLDKVLTEVVNFYQKEIKRTIDLFSALLEPIIIILLGIVITFLAISVLSSLYGVIGTV